MYSGDDCDVSSLIDSIDVLTLPLDTAEKSNGTLPVNVAVESGNMCDCDRNNNDGGNSMGKYDWTPLAL